MRKGINNMMITGNPIAAVRNSSVNDSTQSWRIKRNQGLTDGLRDSESAAETNKLDSNK